MINSERQSLALSLELLAREVDLLRQRHRESLHGAAATEVDDIFASAYALAHKQAPELIPPVPRWQSMEEAREDAKRLARRLGRLPELLSAAGPRRRPRLRVLVGGGT